MELPEDFAHDVATLVHQLSITVKGRFMPPANRHLTLAFLGEVDQAGIAAATEALEVACANVGPIPFCSDGLGKFGRANDATLWLGITPQPQLTDLVTRLREELTARDVAFDTKPFKAHITLARRANLPKQQLGDLAFPRDDSAQVVTLFKSTLDQNGATYKPLHTVNLGENRT